MFWRLFMPKANNVIKVATCHKAGSRKIETIKCAVVEKDKDGKSVWNDSSCKDTDSTFESQNFGKAAFATTGGGSVAAKALQPTAIVQALSKLR